MSQISKEQTLISHVTNEQQIEIFIILKISFRWFVAVSYGAAGLLRHLFNPPVSRSLRQQHGVNHVDGAVGRGDVGLDDGGAVDKDLAT